jgi:hypothetical protein
LELEFYAGRKKLSKQQMQAYQLARLKAQMAKKKTGMSAFESINPITALIEKASGIEHPKSTDLVDFSILNQDDNDALRPMLDEAHKIADIAGFTLRPFPKPELRHTHHSHQQRQLNPLAKDIDVQMIFLDYLFAHHAHRFEEILIDLSDPINKTFDIRKIVTLVRLNGFERERRKNRMEWEEHYLDISTENAEVLIQFWVKLIEIIPVNKTDIWKNTATVFCTDVQLIAY